MSNFIDKILGKPQRKSETAGSNKTETELEKIYPTYNGQGKKGVLNWYKQFPYTFSFTPKSGTTVDFNLPISPSNISISTKFATNTIATMYGTVEEHSEQRYYDISITGTTGISPRYYTTSDAVIDQDTGRQQFSVSDSVNLGGFFNRTKQLIENTLNQVGDLFGGAEKTTSGVDNSKTGYVAFHNFYKFLLLYKKDTSTGGVRSKHPLIFKNNKDQNQYYVVVNNFTLTKDASNPMLYNYNIQMRGYNLTKINGQAPALTDADRFGLNLEPSVFATMTNKARNLRNTAASASSAVKGFGL